MAKSRWNQAIERFLNLFRDFYFFNPILQNGLSGFAEFWNLIVYLFINFFFKEKKLVENNN